MQLDDQLRRAVARRRLAGEDMHARRGRLLAVLAMRQVQVEHVQRVQQLPLVLVDPLGLDVEQPVRVDARRTVAASSSRASRALHARLTAQELVLRNAASSAQGSSCRSFVEVGDPAVADALGDQRRQRGVGAQQPAPRRDAVGLVGEASPATARGSPGTSVRFTSSLCSAATPLTLWLPAIARWAMRTCGVAASSTSDMPLHAPVVAREPRADLARAAGG